MTPEDVAPKEGMPSFEEMMAVPRGPHTCDRCERDLPYTDGGHDDSGEWWLCWECWAELPPASVEEALDG